MTPALSIVHTMSSRRDITAATTSVGLAIVAFGIIYGASATPILGGWRTLLSSAIVFSGSAQFAMVALAGSGASETAIVGTTTLLAIRHLPLGAMVRARMTSGRVQRGLLSWFLIDETAGLTVAFDQPPERTLLVSGGIAYLAWVGGTGIGMAGGSLPGVGPLAEALFPVLFIGLTALAASGRLDVIRSVAAASGTVALLLLWPEAGALGAIGVAIVTAVVGSRG